MEKDKIDDIWTNQKVGTPFPTNVVKAPGETNKYVALWYRHGKPIMGRAWNDSGVMQCTFVLEDKVFTGSDVGGVIQLLLLEPPNKKKSFHYDWVSFKKAKSLTSEGKYEMVRCDYNSPVYWAEHGFLGCINTQLQIAHFVDNDSKILTTNKTEDLQVLCKISGSRESADKAAALNKMTNVNDWEDFNWGSYWPINKNVMSIPKQLGVPDQYVALWYRHGKPIMGRAWPKNGKIDASFVDANREFTGPTVGSLQLLIALPPTTVGYDYVWMNYTLAMDYRDKDFVPVHLSYVVPALVPVGTKLLLGQVNMKTECATVAIDGKVTKLEGGPVKSISVLCRREMAETMLI
uniref:Uncharacterized protein n=1 Tax=Caenorhabditis japonica TaxID=281687 RepID=A0A8R1DNJ3_CAEJA